MQIEDYEYEEMNAERDSWEAEQAEEIKYDAALFEDTWLAEPFDAAELVISQDDGDLPEWMIGSY